MPGLLGDVQTLTRRFLDVEAASRLLGLTEWQFRKAAHKFAVKCFRLPGPSRNKIVYLREDVEAKADDIRASVGHKHAQKKGPRLP